MLSLSISWVALTAWWEGWQQQPNYPGLVEWITFCCHDLNHLPRTVVWRCCCRCPAFNAPWLAVVGSLCAKSLFHTVAMPEPTADISSFVVFLRHLAGFYGKSLIIPALAKYFRPIFDLGLIVYLSFTKKCLILIVRNVDLWFGLLPTLNKIAILTLQRYFCTCNFLFVLLVKQHLFYILARWVDQTWTFFFENWILSVLVMA